MASNTTTDNTQSIIRELERKWENVLECRQQLAEQLDGLADDLSGQLRRRVAEVSRWLKREPDLAGAMKRPDVLAFVNSICRYDGPRPVPIEIVKDSVHHGFGAISHQEHPGIKLCRSLSYPAAILLMGVLIGVGFSFWVAPEFQKMFEEFGIDLPGLTRTVLYLSRVVRYITLPLTIILSLVALIAFGWTWLGQSNRLARPKLMERLFSNTPSTLGSWAWHVALLLEAEIPLATCISTAGKSSDKFWVNRVSQAMAKSVDVLGTKIQAPDSNAPESRFLSSQYQLLEAALCLPTRRAKIDCLKQVALVFWDRSVLVGDWWAQWLVTLLFWLICFGFLVAVYSLFAPLIAIIGGLI